MTQTFYSRPDHPGNLVAKIIDGVGARGSSISDVDNLTVIHNGRASGGPRLLFQEMKWGDESMHPAQRWILCDLAKLPGVTSWCVRLYVRDTGRRELVEDDVEDIVLVDYASREQEHLRVDEYREKVARWWGNGCAHNDAGALFCGEGDDV